MRTPGSFNGEMGFARGTHNRSVAGNRFSSNQILFEVQWRLKTLLSARGYSAYQLIPGSNPTGLLGWGGSDEDLLFA